MESKRKNYVIIDVFGSSVRITKERLSHILMVHPEMKEFQDKIADVLMDPDYIKQSTYDEEVVLYYKYFTSIKKYIIVVVKRHMYFVLTSYMSDRIKKGDVLWRK